MKKILSVWISACLSAGAMAQSALAFDANAGVKSKITVYDGTEVGYTSSDAISFERRRNSQADGFLRPAYICYHEIGGQRVKPSVHTLH